MLRSILSAAVIVVALAGTAVGADYKPAGRAHEVGCCEGFGCRPIALVTTPPEPVSESLQGRDPRDGGGSVGAMGI